MEAAELFGGLVVMGEWLFIRSDQVAAIVWSKEMGTLIRQTRKKKGLSVRDVDSLTEQAGKRISYGYLTQLELGQTPTITQENLICLCGVLDVDFRSIIPSLTVSDPQLGEERVISDVARSRQEIVNRSQLDLSRVAAFEWSKKLGKKLRTLREARGWTVREVETLTEQQGKKVTRGNLSQLEQGIPASVASETLEVLCSIFEMNVLEFLN